MTRLLQWLCGLIGHDVEVIPDTKPKFEDAYCRCKRCGAKWSFYE